MTNVVPVAPPVVVAAGRRRGDAAGENGDFAALLALLAAPAAGGSAAPAWGREKAEGEHRAAPAGPHPLGGPPGQAAPPGEPPEAPAGEPVADLAPGAAPAEPAPVWVDTAPPAPLSAPLPEPAAVAVADVAPSVSAPPRPAVEADPPPADPAPPADVAVVGPAPREPFARARAEPTPAAARLAPAVLDAVATAHRTPSGVVRIVVRLDPPELGNVALSLTARDGEVSLDVATSGTEAAAAVTATRDTLERLLAAEGLDLARFAVNDGRAQAGDGGRRRPETGPRNRAATETTDDPEPRADAAGVWL